MAVSVIINSRAVSLTSSSGNAIRVWKTEPLKPGVVRGGQIMQPEALAQILNILFTTLKLERKNVAACIDGLSFTYRTLSIPALKPAMMKEAVERAARKEIPLPPEDIYIEWFITGQTAEETKVFVIGAPRTEIDAMVKTFSLAGVELGSIDIKPLALARAAARADAIIVDFESDSSEITIVSAGLPSIMHTATPRGENQDIEDLLPQLVDEINRTIDFHNITNKARPITAQTLLLLSGSQARDPAVLERLGQSTGRPVEIIKSKLEIPADMPSMQYAANIGLALKGAGGNQKPVEGAFRDIDINLLISRKRTTTKPRSWRTMAAPVGLAILIALLAPAMLLRNEKAANVTRLQEQVYDVNRSLQIARAIADQSIQNETQIQTLNSQSAAIAGEIGSISGKSKMSADILLLMKDIPQGSEAINTVVTPGEITIQGRMPGTDEIIYYARVLESYGVYKSVRIARIDEETVENTDETFAAFVINIVK